jgi:hypothetical protein
VRGSILRYSLLASLACSGPPGAGRQLGQDLGTFHVEAREILNSCGPGALGSMASFAFDVELARADSELFWNGQIGGQIQASLEFELLAEISVTLRPPRGALPGCSVQRRDQVTGTLRRDTNGALAAFTGAMQYDFAPELASACTPDEQQAAGLASLPCSLRYVLEGQRTRSPEPQPEARADLE